MKNFAQVGIGTTSPKATLEIKSTDETSPANNDGILIPKVTNFPLTNPTADQHGMLLWYSNFATPQLQGFYYWDNNQTKWVQLLASEKGWGITGNSNTTDDHFVGTTDNRPLFFKVNNLLAGQIDHINGNVSLGSNGLQSNTDGYDNTSIGANALENNSTGYDNVAIGKSALILNTTGEGNVAIGSYSLSKILNNGGNVAVGYNSLRNTTTGISNVAVGSGSLYNNLSGSENVSVGRGSLYNNISGDRNVALGRQASSSLLTGNDNVAIGYHTFSYYSGSGSSYQNVIIGNHAGSYTTEGYRNSVVGFNALFYNLAGNHNVGMGDHALYNAISSGNTALGSGSLMNVRTGANNTAVGFQAGRNLPNNVNNTTSIGNGAGFATTTSNQINVGNFSVNWIGGQTGWYTYSDERIKNNIQNDVPGLAFITALNPVTYHLNIRKQNEIANLGKEDESEDWEGKYNIEQIKQTGFLAQQVAEAAQKIGYDFNGVYRPAKGEGLYSLSYSAFVVPLVKAVQEQQVQINDYQNQIQSQQLDIINLHNEIQKISQQYNELVNHLEKIELMVEKLKYKE